ncbi:MAG: TetR/AcrR family transcriptional regulator [Deltaproteobacteria bacterium]|nr:TetR/AcrR family transcriptional regulator [Deltaproteobacteria bacterium]
MTGERRTRRGGRTAPEARAQTRVEILEAAAEAIARRGFWGMSMRDLAKHMGRGLASFYNYFSSKEDVLFALQQGAFEALIARAEQGVAAVPSPAGRLHALILNHVQYVAEHPYVMRVLVHEAGALPPARRRAVRVLKEKYFDIGLGIVRDILHEAAGTPPPALEIERAAYSVFGMINWVWGWYEPDRHGSAEDVARTISRVALSGLVGTARHAGMQEAVEKKLVKVERRPLITSQPHAQGGG